MNYSALKDEFAARGFNYHSDTRRGQYINFARGLLDGMYQWPYRKTSGTGTSAAGTYTNTDLGVPFLVQDSDRASVVLEPGNEADFRARWAGQSLVGPPWGYYVTWSATSGTVTSFPAGGTLVVYYYMNTPDLSGSTDTPMAPTRWHGLIVDMAVQMAYRDSDDHSAAEALQAWINRQVAMMVSDLIQPGSQTEQQHLTYASEDW